MMRSLIRKSFKTELFGCFVIVTIIPLFICGVFMARAIQSRIEKNYEKAAEEQIQSVSGRLNDTLGSISESMISISSEKKVIDGIGVDDSWQRNKTYTYLYDAASQFRDKASLSIYDDQGNREYTTSSNDIISAIPTYWGSFRMARQTPGKVVISKSSFPKVTGNTCLNMAMTISDGSKCIGYLSVDITDSDVKNIIAGAYESTNSIAVLDSHWETLFCSDSGKFSKIASQLRDRRISAGGIRQKDDGVDFVLSPVGDSGLYLMIGRENYFTDDITKTMSGIIALMTVACMLICLITARLMSRYLSEPINKMMQTMHQVEKGNLDSRIDSKRQDELGQVSVSFDRMTEQLKEYMSIRERQQQELNDSNIAMMQAQLNPHFLYNTLDTMKWVAKANHVPELATLASGLGKMLRMSISETKFVRLSDELEMVKSYVDIQKIRFNDSFEYDVEVPDELKDCIVPKLILQPIVENAIIHGFEERKAGCIFVNVYNSENDLVIEVSDDGCGMDKEMMDVINDRDTEKLKGHLGLYNVDTIIHLYYGEEYGISAKAGEEGGTQVSMKMPIRRGSDNVEDTDS